MSQKGKAKLGVCLSGKALVSISSTKGWGPTGPHLPAHLFYSFSHYSHCPRYMAEVLPEMGRSQVSFLAGDEGKTQNLRNTHICSLTGPKQFSAFAKRQRKKS